MFTFAVMKTKKLKYTPDYNFELLGISSTDDDYRLSWHLSRILNSEFARADDLEIIDSRFQEYLLFSVFENLDVAENVSVRLVSNKANIGFLIEELKNIDFFILVFDNENTELINNLISRLKSTENISAVFKLKPESLKSKEKLLF
jgi:hypothetical protein